VNGIGRYWPSARCPPTLAQGNWWWKPENPPIAFTWSSRDQSASKRSARAPLCESRQSGQATSWAFPPYYWHFNAIADEPTEAIFLYGSRLRQECDRDHDFGYELFKRMSQILVVRLQATRVKWIEAAQFNPPRHGIPPDYLII
jgi:hypothetical protein